MAEAIPARLASALRKSRHTVILTGAGISAESGIPVFRDGQHGLWERYRPEDLATPEAFARDPALVWRWYQWRRQELEKARPAPGHMAIAALERLVQRLTLVTQNVDGLHQKAGSSSVIEFHGNIHRNRCSVDNEIVDVSVEGTTKPPRCPQCGARIRPDVVWFGEPIPAAAMAGAFAAVSTCDLFMSVGTSALVHPASGLASAARDSGAMIAEINLTETPISHVVDISVRGTAGSVLSGLVSALS